MKVAFGIRPDYLTNMGGDTIQFLKTKEYLEKDLELDVVIVNEVEDLEKEKFDLLHIFNLQTTEFTLKMVNAAKSKNLTIVLSPIFWHFGDARYVNRMSRLTCNFNLIAGLKGISRISEKLSIRNGFSERKYILEKCDAILPNSYEEGEIVKKIYNVNMPSYVVPNCVDINMTAQEGKQDLLQSDIVLEVGRIEPTKNQLGVLLALMDHKEIPLYFVGKQNPVKKHYINYLKKLAAKRGNTFFVNNIPQEKLISYYKAAKVHVLPSFRESPGLATLEAMYYKANVVVSDSQYCPISYYKLDEFGYVCDPFSIKSIETAIMNAYEDDLNEIPNDYFEFIHYRNAAKMTYNAYNKVFQ